MEIRQSFQVEFAAETVWQCFRDIEALAGCLPGAALTAPPEGGRLMLSMTVKLGPIVANFAGQGEMSLDDAARRGSITGAGSDRKSGSRIKGGAAFSLHDESTSTAATRIDICVEYSMAGSLAQFSRGGLVRELAEHITAQFADNLRKKLDADRAAATAAALDIAREPAAAAAGASSDAPVSPAGAASPGAPAAREPPAAPVAALDLGRMFWPMLIARLRRWLGLGDARSRDD
jgi:carbon monoxide dehydrogenase subunit G